MLISNALKAISIVVILFLLYVGMVYFLFYFKIFEKYLFSWDSIDKNHGNDDVKLINFLKHHFNNIIWIKESKIEKINDYRIKIFTDEKFLSLELNNKKTKVSLEIDGFKAYKFIAKIENKEVKIYPSFCESEAFRKFLWSLKEFWCSILGARILERVTDCRFLEEMESNREARSGLRLIIRNFFKSIPMIIFTFEFIGLLMFFLFDLTMKEEAWFSIFSTIASAFAALVALVGMFLIFHLEFYERKSRIKAKLNKESAKDLMRISFSFSAIIMSFSFILIPFGGSVSINNNANLLYVAYIYEWIIVFLMIGLCIGSLYKIFDAIQRFLSV